MSDSPGSSPTGPTNITFDPYTQPLTIYLADGVTPITFTITDLNAFVLENSEVVINYASQIGASAIMLLVVLLITKESKRKSPIFFLNVISLILSTLRSLLQTLYWVGPFSESYAYFSGDFSAVPRSAYANSVAAVTLTLLLLMCVEGSLVLQTNVVTTTLSPIYRYPILMLSLIISLLAIGFRFALTIQNAKAILATQTAYGIFWLGSAALITETISIWFFCAVFVAKLGWTVWRRRMLGLRQWGPMQILSIMGGCTMIVPSIFAILEYFPTQTFPESGSLALTLVAILLPLSSVWAGASVSSSNPMREVQGNIAPKFGSYESTAVGTSGTRGTGGATTPTKTPRAGGGKGQDWVTASLGNGSGGRGAGGGKGVNMHLVNIDRKGSLGPLTSISNVTTVSSDGLGGMARPGSAGRDSAELDLENGVRIERSYDITRGGGGSRQGSFL